MVNPLSRTLLRPRRRISALLAVLSLFGTSLGIAPARAASPTDRDLDSIQGYLNGLSTLRADFLQVAPDGSVSEGTVYLARPGGRVRLDYAPPSDLLMVGSDGWITVRDEAAGEDSRWPVGGTPFDVLIRDQVDLRRDVRVRGVDRAGGVIRVTVEGKDEPEAGSLTLIFSEGPLELRQWQVLDSQRLLTTVALSNVELNLPLDSFLFEQKDPALWSDEDDD